MKNLDSSCARRCRNDTRPRELLKRGNNPRTSIDDWDYIAGDIDTDGHRVTEFCFLK